jgi:hypothetical protein
MAGIWRRPHEVILTAPAQARSVQPETLLELFDHLAGAVAISARL